MSKAVAKVCCAVIILVITLLSEQCYSLDINYEREVDNVLHSGEELAAPETINYAGSFYEKPVTKFTIQQRDDLLKLLFTGNLYQAENIENEIEDEPKSDKMEDADIAVRNRVVRQAYQGQAPLYPKLPPSSPYNPYQPNYNNQNPQWQAPNNYSLPNYPSTGVSNFYPSAQQNSTYGYHPYNPNQPQYPSYGQRPINGQYPHYNNNSSSSAYPAYRPPNSTVYNSGSSRPPQHGQFNDNTYSTQRPPYFPTIPGNRQPLIGYNNTTNRPSYNNYNTSNWAGNNLSHTSRPNARPPYNAPNGKNAQYFNSYPNNPYGQPNSTYPHNVPNQGNITNRPVQYPYNNYNASSWSGHQPNVQGGGPLYNPPNAQNAQHFNSYPQGPSPNPYNNPSNGQFNPSNGYPSNAHGSDTFLANGYNPAIPNRPPYGSGPGQTQFHYPPGSNGSAHDPTRVSPEYFSYPH